MRFLTPIVVFSVVTTVSPAVSAGEGSETLQYFISRSDVIVVAEVVRLCGAAAKPGLRDYLCEIRVKKVLKQSIYKEHHLPDGERLNVWAMRFEHVADETPEYLSAGSTCVFFLSPASGKNRAWKTVDPWFGVLPHSSALQSHLTTQIEERLQRLLRGAPPQ